MGTGIAPSGFRPNEFLHSKNTQEKLFSYKPFQKNYQEGKQEQVSGWDKRLRMMDRDVSLGGILNRI